MATYATITDVTAYIAKFPLDLTSQPTSTQAALLLTGVDAELNMRLAVVGLAVPFVSDGSSLGTIFAAWIKEVECWGAAAAILHDLLPGVDGPDDTPLWAYYEKKFQAALKGITDRSLLPLTLGAEPTGAEPASHGTRFPDEEPLDGENAEPVFKKSQAGNRDRTF